jgi:microcystin-dependent protein
MPLHGKPQHAGRRETMADPFIGEIRAVSFNYAPEGWLLCDGSVLQINTYQALYALLGNTYGGTYPNTFALPDLRGRSIAGVGISPNANVAPISWGQKTGQSGVALSVSELPPHTHTAVINDPGHSHTSALPQHTHSFSIPCDDGTSGPTLTTPVGNFLSTTAAIDTNVNVAIADAGVANTNTNVGGPFPSVTGTGLYAASGLASMGAGTTGSASAAGGNSTGASAVAVGATGGGGAVPTQSPALGLYYIIATAGIWPPKP